MGERTFTIAGRVQGVGFRPFVYRLARHYGLQGSVRNGAGIVEVRARGTEEALAAFSRDLIEKAPAIARPHILNTSSTAFAEAPPPGFRILPSRPGEQPHNHVPPDYFTCPDCVRELEDPANRRYRYPFINCTQCGPRYTLIQDLPYDRGRTSMAEFELCPDCRAEYDNPDDRRFHAEPVACPVCGPRPSFRQGDREPLEGEAALTAALARLKQGAVVAIKGIGGYHLVCDACNETAVATLRRHKMRPAKPLAVLFPEDGECLKDLTRPSPAEQALLRSPERPIVLVRLREGQTLAPGIAPGLNEIGAMLPYSPLHHLLSRDFGGPLVATSANLSGEPVLTEPAEVEQRLAGVADAFLHHNRPIVRPADDSVVRLIARRQRPIRLGRGMTPGEYALPFQLEKPLLALGGHMKNTLALAWRDRVVISPHLGDLDSPRSLALFARTAEDLQRLYGVQAEAIVADAHPHYASRRWAKGQALPVRRVWHHHAHASALAGEFPGRGPWLVFAWDGVGLGPDGSLWGGESLYGGPGNWRRLGSFRPFRLPGGQRAGREPWRSAAALCWTSGRPWPLDDALPAADSSLARQAWNAQLNCHWSTAAGRLFDGAASLLNLVQQASFEGQGPMLLEALADGHADPVELPLAADTEGVWRTDWLPLIDMLRASDRNPRDKAACFHESLARSLVDQARRLHEFHPFQAVGLSGGVFQNRRLAERVLMLLSEAGFNGYLGEQIPCNDAGLSFGQVIEAACAIHAGRASEEVFGHSEPSHSERT